MDNGLEQVTRLRRELAQQSAQLRELQLLLLRVSGVAAIVLMAIGLVLPAWSEELDDKPVTARVLTTGFVAIWGEEEQVSVAPGVGFIGLVVVVLLLCACWSTLSSQVVDVRAPDLAERSQHWPSSGR